ncbi:MAG: NAD(P)-dependent oxidoreductase [Chloroflexi bacterium]|nr:NAD(P)-dependent oxidoreductase [Chloroflexota bacterium]
MSILVTGGTGYLGRYLIQRLLKEGYKDIVVLDYFPNAASLGEAASQVTLLHGDASDAVDLFNVVSKHKVTDIFHLACQLGEGAPSKTVEVNCLGTVRLFEVARLCGIRRIVLRTSGAVYGHYPRMWRDDEEPVTMESLPKADTIFGASQLFNERVAELFADRYGVDYIGLRLSSIYGFGRGERRTAPRDVYDELIECPVVEDRYVAPPAQQRFAWTYVEDAAEALVRALKADKLPVRIFNMSGEVRTAAETVDYLRTLAPIGKVEFGRAPVRRLPLVDAAPIREYLGFEPKVSMEQGIKDYVEKLLDARARGAL